MVLGIFTTYVLQQEAKSEDVRLEEAVSALDVLEVPRLANLRHHNAKLTFQHVHLQVVLKIVDEEHQVVPELQQLVVPLHFLLAMVTPDHVQIVLRLLDANQEAEQVVVLVEDLRREQQMERPLDIVAEDQQVEETLRVEAVAVDLLLLHVQREQLDLVLNVDARRGHLERPVDVPHHVLVDLIRVQRIQALDELVEKFAAPEQEEIFHQLQLLRQVRLGDGDFAQVLGDADFYVVNDLLERDHRQLLRLLQPVELLEENLLLVAPHRLLLGRRKKV